MVGPRASELVHPISVAVAESLTVDQLAQAFTVYPSMSGSVAEAARRLHHRPELVNARLESSALNHINVIQRAFLLFSRECDK